MLHFTVYVRDNGRKPFRDANGNIVGIFKFTHKYGENASMIIEAQCKDYFRNFSTISGSNKIKIAVMVFNEISNTYMTLYSFYGSEQRFIKH